MSEPATYAGEAPHVDVATSKAAADAAFDGLVKRQRLVMILVRQRGEKGYTVKEFRDKEKFHHGTASSLFTTLHMRGRLVALQEARDGATVYVLPEFVNGRETRPYARMKRKGMTADIAAVLGEHRFEGFSFARQSWECDCGLQIDEADIPEDCMPIEMWEAHVAEEITRRIG